MDANHVDPQHQLQDKMNKQNNQSNADVVKEADTNPGLLSTGDLQTKEDNSISSMSTISDSKCQSISSSEATSELLSNHEGDDCDKSINSTVEVAQTEISTLKTCNIPSESQTSTNTNNMDISVDSKLSVIKNELNSKLGSESVETHINSILMDSEISTTELPGLATNALQSGNHNSTDITKPKIETNKAIETDKVIETAKTVNEQHIDSSDIETSSCSQNQADKINVTGSTEDRIKCSQSQVIKKEEVSDTQKETLMSYRELSSQEQHDSGTGADDSSESSVVFSDIESEDESSKKEKFFIPVEVPKTRGELLPEDLPPLEDLKITIGKDEKLLMFGKVSGMVGTLVIIQSCPNTPALNEETVLFYEDRRVFGKVFEIFGPVSNPFYSVRFNSIDDINNKYGIHVGHIVYCAPNLEEITQYIFIDQLKKIKGSDASWENNNEPPQRYVDFSDDEEERRTKAKRKQERNKNNEETTVKSESYLDVLPGAARSTQHKKQNRGRKNKPNQTNSDLSSPNLFQNYEGGNCWPPREQPPSRFQQPSEQQPTRFQQHREQPYRFQQPGQQQQPNGFQRPNQQQQPHGFQQFRGQQPPNRFQKSREPESYRHLHSSNISPANFNPRFPNTNTYPNSDNRHYNPQDPRQNHQNDLWQQQQQQPLVHQNNLNPRHNFQYQNLPHLNSQRPPFINPYQTNFDSQQNPFLNNVSTSGFNIRPRPPIMDTRFIPNNNQ